MFGQGIVEGFKMVFPCLREDIELMVWDWRVVKVLWEMCVCVCSREKELVKICERVSNREKKDGVIKKRERESYIEKRESDREYYSHSIWPSYRISKNKTHYLYQTHTQPTQNHIHIIYTIKHTLLQYKNMCILCVGTH